MNPRFIRPLAGLFATGALAVLLAGCAPVPPAVSAAAPAAASAPGDPDPDSPFPGAEWARVAPDTQGFAPVRLDAAVAYAKQAGSTAGMIVHGGRVVAEWGDVARKSNLYSARKSFMSALIGIAVGRGQLDPDATLARLGIDDAAPALTPAERQATVRMLLQARSGVYHPTVYETAQMQASKPPRGSHAPGTFWYYNNWDFNTVGAIYEQAAGRGTFAALAAELAGPIGMQDYRASDGHYVGDAAVTRYPAYVINMSARDLARFGLLYLHEGRWRDRQIVPATWVAESTRAYSDTPTGGYGYMWWTSTSASGARGPHAALLRPAYWADGNLGQYAVVVPSLDLVVVSRVDARLTSKSMGQWKMEKFVWLIEAAEGASGIGPEPHLNEPG